MAVWEMYYVPLNLLQETILVEFKLSRRGGADQCVRFPDVRLYLVYL